MPSKHTVSVIGAGDMGHGLATHFALQDQNPILIDHRQSNLDAAKDQISDAVNLLNEEGVVSASPSAIIDQITFTLDTADGVSESDFVIESVSEDLDVKRNIFQEIAGNQKENAILASNTSGIPITKIAEAVPDLADHVVGCHWWNPPYLLTPVEVVSGEKTSTETVNRLQEFVKTVDRDPILVNHDVPGFVWNRVQFAVFRECMHLLEEGVASADDINRAIRDGYAMRTAVIGPFETVDVNGVGLIQTVAKNLYPALSDTDEPHEILDQLLNEGRGGIMDGEGFFDYDQTPSEKLQERDKSIATLRQSLTEE